MIRTKYYVSYLVIFIVLAMVVACAGANTDVSPPTPVPATATPETVSPTPVVENAKKAVILFSYEPDFWATADEDRGVVSGLETMGFTEGDNIEVTRLYMKTKTVNKTQEQMQALALEIVAEIEKVGPDVVFIMDDDALRHVGSKLLDTDTPVVFAGVNGFPNDDNYSPLGPLADSLEQPGHNITGILERVSFKAGFELLSQVLPEARTALFVTDNSSVSNLLLKGAGGEAELNEAAIEVVDKLYTDEFEELKTIILEHQDKVDAIVLFLPWTIVDSEGNHVPQDEVVAWLMKNSRRPSIAFLDILAQEGYLVGTVVDMEQQGHHAGLAGGRILQGDNPAEMPIIDPIANRVVINLARANQLGIEIPFEVLKNADIVYQEMSAYPEYQKK